MLCVSFGVVLAELLFGGWGRNFLSAAVAAPAFAFMSFPEIAHPSPTLLVALGAGLSGTILVVLGLLSGRIIAAAGLAVAAFWAVSPLPIDALGAIGFAAVFLLGDPVASASTRVGGDELRIGKLLFPLQLARISLSSQWQNQWLGSARSDLAVY